MIPNGLYKAENNDDYLSHYKVVLDVNETEKSYIFRLIELESRYNADHIKMLFKKSERAVIRKDKGGHAIRTWGDGAFTLYPFQAGVPFYFEPLKREAQTNA